MKVPELLKKPWVIITIADVGLLVLLGGGIGIYCIFFSSKELSPTNNEGAITTPSTTASRPPVDPYTKVKSAMDKISKAKNVNDLVKAIPAVYFEKKQLEDLKAKLTDENQKKELDKLISVSEQIANLATNAKHKKTDDTDKFEKDLKEVSTILGLNEEAVKKFKEEVKLADKADFDKLDRVTPSKLNLTSTTSQSTGTRGTTDESQLTAEELAKKKAAEKAAAEKKAAEEAAAKKAAEEQAAKEKAAKEKAEKEAEELEEAIEQFSKDYSIYYQADGKIRIKDKDFEKTLEAFAKLDDKIVDGLELDDDALKRLEKIKELANDADAIALLKKNVDAKRDEEMTAENREPFETYQTILEGASAWLKSHPLPPNYDDLVSFVNDDTKCIKEDECPLDEKCIEQLLHCKLTDVEEFKKLFKTEKAAIANAIFTNLLATLQEIKKNPTPGSEGRAQSLKPQKNKLLTEDAINWLIAYCKSGGKTGSDTSSNKFEDRDWSKFKFDITKKEDRDIVRIYNEATDGKSSSAKELKAELQVLKDAITAFESSTRTTGDLAKIELLTTNSTCKKYVLQRTVTDWLKNPKNKPSAQGSYDGCKNEAFGTLITAVTGTTDATQQKNARDAFLESINKCIKDPSAAKATESALELKKPLDITDEAKKEASFKSLKRIITDHFHNEKRDKIVKEINVDKADIDKVFGDVATDYNNLSKFIDSSTPTLTPAEFRKYFFIHYRDHLLNGLKSTEIQHWLSTALKIKPDCNSLEENKENFQKVFKELCSKSKQLNEPNLVALLKSNLPKAIGETKKLPELLGILNLRTAAEELTTVPKANIEKYSNSPVDIESDAKKLQIAWQVQQFALSKIADSGTFNKTKVDSATSTIDKDLKAVWDDLFREKLANLNGANYDQEVKQALQTLVDEAKLAFDKNYDAKRKELIGYTIAQIGKGGKSHLSRTRTGDSAAATKAKFESLIQSFPKDVVKADKLNEFNAKVKDFGTTAVQKFGPFKALAQQFLAHKDSLDISNKVEEYLDERISKAADKEKSLLEACKAHLRFLRSLKAFEKISSANANLKQLASFNLDKPKATVLLAEKGQPGYDIAFKELAEAMDNLKERNDKIEQGGCSNESHEYEKALIAYGFATLDERVKDPKNKAIQSKLQQLLDAPNKPSMALLDNMLYVKEDLEALTGLFRDGKYDSFIKTPLDHVGLVKQLTDDRKNDLKLLVERYKPLLDEIASRFDSEAELKAALKDDKKGPLSVETRQKFLDELYNNLYPTA